MDSEKIDFVLTWVDENDPKWQDDLNKHKSLGGDSSQSRFRNWDNLQYLFRAIEEFTPWVNKIYFVTYGHTPVWLNKNHQKLVIVKHEDFMDKEHLPVFNSCAIEVNLHKIKGLSEKFVYFNDDTFILKPLKKTVFFKNNLPKNVALSYVIPNCEIEHIELNNISIINKHFNKKINYKYKKNNIIINNIFKWFYPGYALHSFKTLTLMQWPYFTGFKKYHQAQPFLKTTFKEIWKKEEALLNKVSASRFRSNTDVSQYLFKYWQFVSGNFYPDTYKNAYKKRKHIGIRTKEDAIKVANLISSHKYEMFCPNDHMSKGMYTDQDISESNFLFSRNIINKALKKILPSKSSFELD